RDSRDPPRQRMESGQPRRDRRERPGHGADRRAQAHAWHVSADVRYGHLPPRSGNLASVFSRSKDHLPGARADGAYSRAAVVESIRVFDVPWNLKLATVMESLATVCPENWS